MNVLRTAALLFAALSLSVLPVAHAHDHAGKDTHTDQETQADIARHQAMAAAHEAAARCLAAGKGHDTCQKELAQACKGLALGKHCGMRHSH